MGEPSEKAIRLSSCLCQTLVNAAKESIVPPACTLHATCQVLVQLEGEISRTREQLSNTAKRLDDLLQQRIPLLSAANQNHDVILQHLPTELICRIFRFYIPEPDERELIGTSPAWWEGDKELYCVASVSKTWRQIALSMPEIWAKLALNLDRFVKNPEVSLEMLEDFLSRSRTRPLSFFIFGSRENAMCYPLFKLFNLFNAEYARWRCVGFLAPKKVISRFHGQRQATTNAGKRSMLCNLTIHCSDSSMSQTVYPEFPYPIFRTFGVSTSPERIHIQGACTWVRNFDIAWDNLTDLTIDAMAYLEFMHLLRTAPRLRSFKCGYLADLPKRWFGGRTLSTSSVIHKQLINFTGGYVPDTMLQLVAFPSLESLSLVSVGSLDSLKIFLTPSTPAGSCLEELYLHDSPNVNLVEILLLVSLSLKRLNLTDTSSESINDVFQFLAETASRRQMDQNRNLILPKLESIFYTGEPDSDFLWSHLPLLFPPVHDEELSSQGPVYRPFNSLIMRLELSDDLDFDDYIDLVTCAQLKRIAKRGYTVDIENESDGCNFLEQSIIWHYDGQSEQSLFEALLPNSDEMDMDEESDRDMDE